MEQQQRRRRDRVEFFGKFTTTFQEAVSQVGIVERFYNIGDYPVRLCFAGEALIKSLTPAIAHLEIPATPSPALTIQIFDSASTQTELPLLVSSLVSLLSQRWWKYEDKRGQVTEYSGDRIQTAFHPYPNRFNLVDLEENQGIYWIEDAENFPYYEIGAALRIILHWWLSKRSRQYVHAGAVGTPDGGVLLVGKGGSGKSSTALACLDSDLSYASDDYCLVRTTPEPYVYSLYNTGKLKGEADLKRFPELIPQLENRDRLDEEKAMIFVHKYYPEKVISGFPIRAILIPQVTGKPDTKLLKATAGRALSALAPSTILQLPGATQTSLKTMAELVRKVPCYHLHLGTEIKQIPGAIAQLLK
ncbi:MAG: hypothetical protein SAJ37_05470 [Oscillatoria sp. PMC 1068.18]|nr:hypothetical protein [Oscillatoria sp. PMC 1076.18]MEC4988179.1 hypothetical protein [Oscillatoria sp. PMC 1068.18]